MPRSGQPVQAAAAGFSGACAGCAKTAYANWSPSCSAITCTSRTPRVARPSGAVSRYVAVYGERRGSRYAWSNSPVRDLHRARSGHVAGSRACVTALVGKLKPWRRNDKTPAETRILSRRTSTPWPMASRTPRPSGARSRARGCCRDGCRRAPRSCRTRVPEQEVRHGCQRRQLVPRHRLHGGLDPRAGIRRGRERVRVRHRCALSQHRRSGFERQPTSSARSPSSRPRAGRQKSLTEIAMAYGCVCTWRRLLMGAKPARRTSKAIMTEAYRDRR